MRNLAVARRDRGVKVTLTLSDAKMATLAEVDGVDALDDIARLNTSARARPGQDPSLATAALQVDADGLLRDLNSRGCCSSGWSCVTCGCCRSRSTSR